MRTLRTSLLFAVAAISVHAQQIETNLGSPEKDEVNELYSQITVSAKTSVPYTDAFLFTMWFKNGRVESKVIHVSGQTQADKSGSATFHWVTEKTLPAFFKAETISLVSGNSQVIYSTPKQEAKLQ